MTVEAIKAAIEQLGEPERRELPTGSSSSKKRLGTPKRSRTLLPLAAPIALSRRSIAKSTRVSSRRWSSACAPDKITIEFHVSRAPEFSKLPGGSLDENAIETVRTLKFGHTVQNRLPDTVCVIVEDPIRLAHR